MREFYYQRSQCRTSSFFVGSVNLATRSQYYSVMCVKKDFFPRSAVKLISSGHLLNFSALCVWRRISSRDQPYNWSAQVTCSNSQRYVCEERFLPEISHTIDQLRSSAQFLSVMCVKKEFFPRSAVQLISSGYLLQFSAEYIMKSLSYLAKYSSRPILFEKFLRFKTNLKTKWGFIL